MIPPTFLDANVPIYAAGRPHRLKEPSSQVLMLAAERPASFVTDAEVLQELLHRYLALRLWPQGREAFHRFADLMRERVEPVQASDVEQAALLADEYPELGARDLLHAAVMRRLGVRRLVSADAGFDRLSALERLDPADVETWRDKLQE
jgi:predicted nucleic acid-binding protein